MCTWLVTKPEDSGKRVQNLSDISNRFKAVLLLGQLQSALVCQRICVSNKSICVAVVTVAAQGCTCRRFTTVASQPAPERMSGKRAPGMPCDTRLVLFGRRKACDLKQRIGMGPLGGSTPFKAPSANVFLLINPSLAVHFNGSSGIADSSREVLFWPKFLLLVVTPLSHCGRDESW